MKPLTLLCPAPWEVSDTDSPAILEHTCKALVRELKCPYFSHHYIQFHSPGIFINCSLAGKDCEGAISTPSLHSVCTQKNYGMLIKCKMLTILRKSAN